MSFFSSDLLKDIVLIKITKTVHIDKKIMSSVVIYLKSNIKINPNGSNKIITEMIQ